MQTDAFSYNTSGLTSPWTRHYEITPSDTDLLPDRPRQIEAQSDGMAVLEDEAGTVLTYNCWDGRAFVGRIVKVWATHPETGDTTTATLYAHY